MKLNLWNFWSQDLKGRCKEKTGKAAKVSDLRDWGGRQEVVLMQVTFVLTISFTQIWHILQKTCSVCEQKYEDRMELMQHMRQHNAVR